MGIGISSAQTLLELQSSGHLSEVSSVCDMGATEIHITKTDLKELLSQTKINLSKSIDEIPNIDNWPGKNPRTSAKYLYELLSKVNFYKSIDLNGLYHSIKHDLNFPFTDQEYLNRFDLVTDFGSCEHVFNVAEAYKTMHKLTKVNGLMIIVQNLYNGNGYFNFDEGFVRGIAASNSYDIINCSYIIASNEKTSSGTFYEYHIPMSKKLFDVLNLTKIRSVGICAVFKKKSENQFIYPYQGDYMEKVHGIAGFNHKYIDDKTMNFRYIKSSKKEIREVKFLDLIKEFFKRIFKKMS
tara:strand:- start:7061 stop:7948 length:888 start_codon:yes stop_codon:yes gene_type:complete